MVRCCSLAMSSLFTALLLCLVVWKQCLRRSTVWCASWLFYLPCFVRPLWSHKFYLSSPKTATARSKKEKLAIMGGPFTQQSSSTSWINLLELRSFTGAILHLYKFFLFINNLLVHLLLVAHCDVVMHLPYLLLFF